MINPGTKLNYEQWRYLSGGNSRGYKRYEREYKRHLNNFYKNGACVQITEERNNRERRIA